jgi:hypothetical protein
MRKEDLKMFELYVHTGEKMYAEGAIKTLKFLEIIENPGFWSARFKRMSGVGYEEIAGWAVEKYVVPFKIEKG